ncbi:hypothetical protein ACOME3_006530 [Neoechinorhynchus agilis]
MEFMSFDWFDNDTEDSIAPLNADELGYLEMLRSKERFYMSEEIVDDLDKTRLSILTYHSKKEQNETGIELLNKLSQKLSKAAPIDQFLSTRAENFQLLERDHAAMISSLEVFFHPCQILSKSQDRLTDEIDCIQRRLRYFSITRSLVRKLESNMILTSVDIIANQILPQAKECLGFMRAHREYKEAEIYENTLRDTVIPKCLSILKESSIEILRLASNGLSNSKDKVKENPSYEEVFNRVYGEFRMNTCLKLQQIIDAISRIEDGGGLAFEETERKLAKMVIEDCVMAYVNCRKQMILDPVKKQIESHHESTGKMKKHSFVYYLRQSLDLIFAVCENENQLIGEVFRSMSGSSAALFSINEHLFNHICDALVKIFLE